MASLTTGAVAAAGAGGRFSLSFLPFSAEAFGDGAVAIAVVSLFQPEVRARASPRLRVQTQRRLIVVDGANHVGGLMQPHGLREQDRVRNPEARPARPATALASQATRRPATTRWNLIVGRAYSLRENSILTPVNP